MPTSPRSASSSRHADAAAARVGVGIGSGFRAGPTRRCPRVRGALLTGLLAMALGLAALVLPAGSAAAADSYRFWGFYQLSGSTWAFASKGADLTVPADGTVDGWRLAVGDMSVTRVPRATLTFDAICADTPTQAGKKRVGVVLDFGRPADNERGANVPAPRAQCAVVDTNATSQAVLAAVAPIRADKGMICAVENTPATGCGGKVANPTPEMAAPDTPVDIPVVAAGSPAAPTSAATTADASPTDGATAPAADSADSGGPSVTTVLLILLVLVALVLAGWLSMRRRRR